MVARRSQSKQPSDADYPTDEDVAIRNRNASIPRLVVCHLILLISIPVSVIVGLPLMAAALSFFVLFLVTGQSLRIGLLTSYTKENGFSTLKNEIALDVMISVFVSTSVVALLAGTGHLDKAFPALVGVIIVSDVIGLISHHDSWSVLPSSSQLDYGRFLRLAAPAVICFVIGLAMVIWRTSHFNWPEASGTDLFTHLGVVQRIIHDNGGISPSDDYPYIFHALVATIGVTSGANPFLVLAYGYVLTYPVGVLIVYSFVNSIVGDSGKSLLTAGLYNFVAQGGSLLDIHYVYPAVWAFLATLVVLTNIRNLPRTKFTQISTLSSYFMIIIVYPNILFATGPLIIYFWSQWAIKSDVASGIAKRICVLGITGGLSLITLYYVLLPLLGFPPGPVDTGVDALAMAPTLDRNVMIILMGYSVLQLMLLLLGLIWLGWRVLHNEVTLREPADDIFIIMTVTLYLVVFFLPFSFGFRTEMFMRPLNFICIMIGSFCFVQSARKFLPRLIAARFTRTVSLSKGLSSLLLLMLLLAAVAPTAIKMDYQMTYEPHNPHIDEYLAFEWLGSRVPEGGYVLTDPATGFLMRGFILRNCSTSKIESGRFPYPLKDMNLYDRIFSFFNAIQGEESESYQEIADSCGEVTYIVVSYRTSCWLQLARSGNTGLYSIYAQWTPPSDPSLSKFQTPSYTLVKQFGNTSILVRI